MIRRRWISCVVMLGVLLHAYALVRHNGVMLNAHLQRASLVADLHALCNPTGASAIDTAGLPDVPLPTDAQNGCPMCPGLVFAAVLPEPIAEPHYLAFDPPVLRSIAQAPPISHPRTLSPPVRGPPSLV